MRGAPYQPGYFLLESLQPERSLPPERAQGWYGKLSLRGVCEKPVHVGSGAPERVRIQNREALIEGFSTLPTDSGPAPVIPGSSWKGAVRAIVEALTPSCERTGAGGCNRNRSDMLCPACALFGAPHWRALVMFSDLQPAPETVPIAVTIAQRYSQRSAPRKGRRLYRPQPESPQPRDSETLMALPQGTRLEGTINFTGATDESLGLLTLVLGLGRLGLPYLRIGGGKNRELGFVRFSLVDAAGGRGVAALASTRSVDLSGRIDEWQEAARRRFPLLDGRLESIRSHYSGY